MQNKKVSLIDMVKLSQNPELSEPYVRYLCGLRHDSKYRHKEIEDILSLIKSLSIPEMFYSGFIYGYVVPQLNKEFDLLRITDNICLNIELKSEAVVPEKIVRQLIQNQHYLKLLNRSQLLLFSYISSTGELYKLNQDDKLLKCSIRELENILTVMGEKTNPIDLDEVFTPINILVSPLNSTERFLRKDYLLTENQENIKKDILSYVNSISTDRFIGLTGGPGTGKTLLIYDIAQTLAREQRILIVHSGILCDGHLKLDESLENIKIIPAKALRFREINNVDIVIVDEAHRLYTNSLEKVERWVKRTKATCIFSFDAGQTLSNAEKWRDTSKKIEMLCFGHIFKLTNKIRTNKELALFITCLRDLSKFREEYAFPNVSIFFEPDKTKAMLKVQSLKDEGYTFISYTPSIYYSNLNFQEDIYNTHNVIGQEFDGVCMLLDDNFYYTDDGKIMGKMHPNPDYIFVQLLYQGLTRVRSKIALVITSEVLLQRILPLVSNN